MQKFKRKEKKNRLIVLHFEDIRKILKSIVKNENLFNLNRWNAILKLTNLTKKSIKIRLLNRCIFTGRKGKLTYLYKFSRLTFLKLARDGFISGLNKSVW